MPELGYAASSLPSLETSGNERLYLFPRAAMTKYQKLGGLKQQRFIV